jgi:hypothetical protein
MIAQNENTFLKSQVSNYRHLHPMLLCVLFVGHDRSELEYISQDLFQGSLWSSHSLLFVFCFYSPSISSVLQYVIASGKVLKCPAEPIDVESTGGKAEGASDTTSSSSWVKKGMFE